MEDATEAFRRLQREITAIARDIRAVREWANDELGYQWELRLELNSSIYRDYGEGRIVFRRFGGKDFVRRATAYRDWLIDLGGRRHRGAVEYLRVLEVYREAFEGLRAFLQRSGWGTGHNFLNRVRSYIIQWERQCERGGGGAESEEIVVTN